MQAAYGEAWHKVPYSEEQTWGEVLLTPSLIYTPLINALIQAAVPLAGIAHITGGGIADNFSRVLKANQVGAELDQLFAPLPVMERLMDLGQVSHQDAYLYWNMGNGMLLVADQEQVETILAQAQKLDYAAQDAGTITDVPRIRLTTPLAVLEEAY